MFSKLAVHHHIGAFGQRQSKLEVGVRVPRVVPMCSRQAKHIKSSWNCQSSEKDCSTLSTVLCLHTWASGVLLNKVLSKSQITMTCSELWQGPPHPFNRNLLSYDEARLHYSPLLKNNCVRQVASDRWFPIVVGIISIIVFISVGQVTLRARKVRLRMLCACLAMFAPAGQMPVNALGWKSKENKQGGN